MCWDCDYCDRDFSKAFALAQHISQTHPYIKDSTESTNQAVTTERFDDNAWVLPEFNPNSSIIYEVNCINYIALL